MPARRTSGAIWISIERVHCRTPFIGVDVHEVGCLKLLAYLSTGTDEELTYVVPMILSAFRSAPKKKTASATEPIHQG